MVRMTSFHVTQAAKAWLLCAKGSEMCPPPNDDAFGRSSKIGSFHFSG